MAVAAGGQGAGLVQARAAPLVSRRSETGTRPCARRARAISRFGKPVGLPRRGHARGPPVRRTRLVKVGGARVGCLALRLTRRIIPTGNYG